MSIMSLASWAGSRGRLRVWLPITQIRAYRWCSPPRIGRAIMSPNRSIGRLQGASLPSERCVRTVIVANEILRCRVPRKRFSDLARQPLGRRIAGHCKPQQLPTFVAENKKCEELLKRNRRNHEQINRRKIVRAFFADAALVSGRDFHPMVHPNEILTSRSNT